MIQLVEGLPRKLSGSSSIYMKNSYGIPVDAIFDDTVIKHFDKKANEWEFSVFSLAKILDALSELDSIDLALMQSHGFLLEEPSYKAKIEPKEYQVDAVRFGLSKGSFLLLDGMGLGKTFESILFACELKKRGLISHCLIICGVNTVKTNWLNEIRKFTDETAMVLGQRIGPKGGVYYASLKERADILRNPIDEFFVITNIETFQDESIINAIKKSKNGFGCIIVDEVHKMTNPKSIRTKNILKLDAKFKVGLTGTILLNKPTDCHIPLKWIGADKATLTQFRDQYVIYGGYGGKEIVGYRNLEILKDELDRNSLRRLKEEVLDLGSKTIIDEIVDMSQQQQDFYNDIRNGVKDEVDKVELTSNSILALTTRLRQASTCPSALSSTMTASAKIDRALDLIEQIESDGGKVVVFSMFKETIRMMAKSLQKGTYVLVDGDTNEKLSQKSVDMFMADDRIKVFLGTYSKCSTGINLYSASYMICMDENWVPAVQNQAYDRIYRLGQTKPVIIYNLICSGTIDEHVARTLKVKQAYSDIMVDGKRPIDDINEMRNYLKGL